MKDGMKMSKVCAKRESRFPPPTRMLIRAGGHQFLKQPRLLFVKIAGLDLLSLELRPIQKPTVLNLLLVGKMVMFSHIGLQQLKVPIPQFVTSHSESKYIASTPHLGHFTGGVAPSC